MPDFKSSVQTLVLDSIYASCVGADRARVPPTPIVPHDRRRSVGGAARPDVVALGLRRGDRQHRGGEDGYRERERCGQTVGTGRRRSHACLTLGPFRLRPPTFRSGTGAAGCPASAAVPPPTHGAGRPPLARREIPRGSPSSNRLAKRDVGRAPRPAQPAEKANGSSSATSASFGPVASRSETWISSPASGHCTAIWGSS